jgi:hypothetical protein
MRFGGNSPLSLPLGVFTIPGWRFPHIEATVIKTCRRAIANMLVPFSMHTAEMGLSPIPGREIPRWPPYFALAFPRNDPMASKGRPGGG